MSESVDFPGFLVFLCDWMQRSAADCLPSPAALVSKVQLNQGHPPSLPLGLTLHNMHTPRHVPF